MIKIIFDKRFVFLFIVLFFSVFMIPLYAEDFSNNNIDIFLADKYNIENLNEYGSYFHYYNLEKLNFFSTNLFYFYIFFNYETDKNISINKANNQYIFLFEKIILKNFENNYKSIKKNLIINNKIFADSKLQQEKSFKESKLRRAEILFFISIPFIYLYVDNLLKINNYLIFGDFNKNFDIFQKRILYVSFIFFGLDVIYNDLLKRSKSG